MIGRSSLTHHTNQPAQATITGLDRLGMYVKVESKYGSSKLRLPFTRECTDRKVCKEIIVEMTRASAGSAAPAPKKAE